MQETAQRVREHLAAATAAAKCWNCACFHDTLTGLAASDLAEELVDALGRARSTLGKRTYDCLGCETCWPALAWNAACEVVQLMPGGGCLEDAPLRREGWPPFPGEYRVLRFAAPVAVCTLHTTSLVTDIFTLSPTGLSLVGALQTENLGIERLIENVITNPHLRVLVLCGEDTGGEVGHYPGQSLRALVENGLDGEGRIVGARGKRPELCNLPRECVARFRAQVRIEDHGGELDPRRIGVAVSEAAHHAPGPLPGVPPEGRESPLVVAAPPARLVLDPAGYVVVVLDRRRGMLLAEQYDNHGVLHMVVEGATAIEVMSTLLREEVVTRLDHCAYVARELTLAERALADGAPYVQDRAPGPARTGPPRDGSPPRGGRR